MVIYLDTSAWLKVYVREVDHDFVEEAIQNSELAATSVIAHAEARSGLARRMREGDFTDKEHADIVHGLDSDWNMLVQVPVLARVVRDAGGWHNAMLCVGAMPSIWLQRCTLLSGSMISSSWRSIANW